MAYTDSDAATASLPIIGVWLHDPDADQETARGFLYGKSARSDSYDSMGASSFYVGRSAPVVEFGEFESFAVDATIDVPYGATYADDIGFLRAFAASKLNLWYRDNRGRAVYGWISAFKVSDADWGSQVALTFTEAHHETTEVSA